MNLAAADTKFTDAFKMADEVLLQATKGISDLITLPGLINLDFADVKTVMAEMGDALMGIGYGAGEGRAKEAATQAISSPLLDNVSIDGAKAVLINITGNSNMSLLDVNEAASLITEAVGTDANIIFGAVIDESLQDEIRVTVIATGFGNGSRSVETESASDLFSSRKLVFEKSSGKQMEPAAEPQRVVQRSKVKSFQTDDWEVPTFLRKQNGG
jgi:cell division protein FtsZ